MRRPSLTSASDATLPLSDPAAALPSAEPVARTSEPAEPSAAPASAEALGLMCDEVLGFAAQLIPDLPLGVSLLCKRLDVAGPHAALVLVTTSRAAYAAARAARIPALVGSELLALTLAAKADRVTPAAAAQWWRAKADSAGWLLTPAVALGDVAPLAKPRDFTLGQVVSAAGLALLSVSTGDDVPAELQGGSL